VDSGLEKKPLEILLPSLELVPTTGSPIKDFNEVLADAASPNPVENEFQLIWVFCAKADEIKSKEGNMCLGLKGKRKRDIVLMITSINKLFQINRMNILNAVHFCLYFEYFIFEELQLV
jgi:hypothetical protein